MFCNRHTTPSRSSSTMRRLSLPGSHDRAAVTTLASDF